MHALLRASPYAVEVRKVFGQRLNFRLRDHEASDADPSEFWLQDGAPKRVRLRDGTMELVGHLSTHPKRSAVFNALRTTRPTRVFTFHPSPYQPVISYGPQEGRWARHEVMPIVLEGGNLVPVGGKVFVRHKVLTDNALDWVNQHGLRHLKPQRDSSATSTHLRPWAQPPSATSA